MVLVRGGNNIIYRGTARRARQIGHAAEHICRSDFRDMFSPFWTERPERERGVSSSSSSTTTTTTSSSSLKTPVARQEMSDFEPELPTMSRQISSQSGASGGQ